MNPAPGYVIGFMILTTDATACQRCCYFFCHRRVAILFAIDMSDSDPTVGLTVVRKIGRSRSRTEAEAESPKVGIGESEGRKVRQSESRRDGKVGTVGVGKSESESRRVGESESRRVGKYLDQHLGNHGSREVNLQRSALQVDGVDLIIDLSLLPLCVNTRADRPRLRVPLSTGALAAFPAVPRPGQQYFYVWHLLRQGIRFPARSFHLYIGTTTTFLM
eukprot:gene24831-biopygen22430